MSTNGSNPLTTGPALLVADEPTTALDVTVQAEVLRQLRRLQREHGTAVLFISHDIGVVGALCDTVLVLRDGRVVDRRGVHGRRPVHRRGGLSAGPELRRLHLLR